MINNLLNAQGWECFTPPDEDTVQNDPKYILAPDMPIKTIRVNFHYLLRSYSTGNFTETSDNYTDRPYNGYKYAEDMVKWCNQQWNINPLLQHMPDPPVQNLPKKIQLQLCGVYFHRNTADYNYYSCNTIFPIFTENSGEVINIYITKSLGGGCAGFCSSEQTLIGTAYDDYKRSVDSNNTWYNSFSYKLINHELGHLFNLSHAIQNCCTKLPNPPSDCNNCDDKINDTPNLFELIYLHYLPCEWNHPLGSNNLMDYCAGQNALSPMQISRMHACIDENKLFYRNCKYQTQTLNITTFTTNKAYIAKYVIVPSRNSIVVGNNSALFINAEEFTINGEFELQSGSILNVDIIPSCN